MLSFKLLSDIFYDVSFCILHQGMNTCWLRSSKSVSRGTRALTPLTSQQFWTENYFPRHLRFFLIPILPTWLYTLGQKLDCSFLSKFSRLQYERYCCLLNPTWCKRHVFSAFLHFPIWCIISFLLFQMPKQHQQSSYLLLMVSSPILLEVWETYFDCSRFVQSLYSTHIWPEEIVE